MSFFSHDPLSNVQIPCILQSNQNTTCKLMHEEFPWQRPKYICTLLCCIRTSRELYNNVRSWQTGQSVFGWLVLSCLPPRFSCIDGRVEGRQKVASKRIFPKPEVFLMKGEYPTCTVMPVAREQDLTLGGFASEDNRTTPWGQWKWRHHQVTPFKDVEGASAPDIRPVTLSVWSKRKVWLFWGHSTIHPSQVNVVNNDSPFQLCESLIGFVPDNKVGTFPIHHYWVR